MIKVAENHEELAVVNVNVKKGQGHPEVQEAEAEALEGHGHRLLAKPSKSIKNKLCFQYLQIQRRRKILLFDECVYTRFYLASAHPRGEQLVYVCCPASIKPDKSNECQI